MVVVITKNQVKSRAEYLRIAKKFVSEARCDAGCLGMQILTREDEPNHVTFISRWEKKSDFEAHCAGSSFAKYIPQMAQYYEGGTDTFYDVVS